MGFQNKRKQEMVMEASPSTTIGKEAVGQKKPPHQREPRPGYVCAMRLFMMASLQAAPLAPDFGGITAWPLGLPLEVNVTIDLMGDSAGSYAAIVLAAVVEEPASPQAEWQEAKPKLKIRDLPQNERRQTSALTDLQEEPN